MLDMNKNLWILVQVLGAILIFFGNRWIPGLLGLIIGIILVLWGGIQYRKAGKNKK